MHTSLRYMGCERCRLALNQNVRTSLNINNLSVLDQDAMQISPHIYDRLCNSLETRGIKDHDFDVTLSRNIREKEFSDYGTSRKVWIQRVLFCANTIQLQSLHNYDLWYRMGL